MCSVSLGAKSDNKYLNRFLRWLRKGERSQEITSTRYQREQELAADQQRDKDTRDTNNYSTKLYLIHSAPHSMRATVPSSFTIYKRQEQFWPAASE